MKKIFYLMSICALAFVSCQKEELAGNEAADGKYTYAFSALVTGPFLFLVPRILQCVS